MSVNRDDLPAMSEPTDSWGFTDADHADFQRLMDKYGDDGDVIPEIMAAIQQNGEGVQPMPDDPGLMGELGRITADCEGATSRVFPKGGLWRSILEHLRERER